MATMASHIAARLVQDTQIVSYTADRVYAYDIRLAGPEAKAVRSANGFVLPHIVVDDAGGLKSPFSPPGTFTDQLRVWIFAENSSTGRTAIDELAKRVRVRLDRWQEANTKAMVLFSNRTGFIADPPPSTGAMDSLTFNVAGVAIGVAT